MGQNAQVRIFARDIAFFTVNAAIYPCSPFKGGYTVWVSEDPNVMKKPVCIIVAAIIAIVIGGVMAVFLLGDSKHEAVRETVDTMDVFVPAGKGKMHVVFLAHNGGQTKEFWGDFPEYLESQGYAVVNMGWTDMRGGMDFKKNIAKVMERYGKVMDFKRVSFVGGCHGAVKLLAASDAQLPIAPASLVLLSMSEQYSPPSKHVPILGVRTLRDNLGPGYVAIQQKVYESTVTEPKKVLVLDATPHGDELVTDPSTKDQVRSEILSWIAKK